MTNTKLQYLEDFNLLTSDAKVLQVTEENAEMGFMCYKLFLLTKRKNSVRS